MQSAARVELNVTLSVYPDFVHYHYGARSDPQPWDTMLFATCMHSQSFLLSLPTIRSLCVPDLSRRLQQLWCNGCHYANAPCLSYRAAWQVGRGFFHDQWNGLVRTARRGLLQWSRSRSVGGSVTLLVSLKSTCVVNCHHCLGVPN